MAGKTIVITGAGKGIGLALTRHFLKQGQGNHVVAISRRVEALEDLNNETWDDAGYSIIGASLTHQYAEIVEEISKQCAVVDVLINNAGLLINKPIRETSDADLQKLWDINFNVPVKLSRDLLRLMKRGSHIVNIGSMGGFQGSSKFPGLSIYSATKGALATFSECMAEELKEDGIAVNCLALGAVQTEMLAAAFPGFQAPTSAEQMAEWIAYFAMNGQQWFNGKVVPVSVTTP